MKTVAYLRVSTRSQDLANQKLAILEFSQKRRFPIDQFIESRISSRQSPLERRIDEMLGTLEPGDRLLVSELSRLGRSLSQVIQIVETLVRRKIRFIAIKEAIEFDGKQDLPTKVMIALFGLFAEVERDLISERTKEGLAAAKAKGKRLGRPKGALGTSRLDGKQQDIRALLGKDVSKASIAKILDVSRSALYHLHPDLKWKSSGNMSHFYWYKTSASSVPVRTGRSEHTDHRKPHDHTFEYTIVVGTGPLAGRRGPDTDWRRALPMHSSPPGTRGRSLASTEDCRH